MGKWVTAKQAAQPEEGTAQKAILLNSLHGIDRAGRGKTAGGRQTRRDPIFIALQQNNRGLTGNFCNLHALGIPATKRFHSRTDLGWVVEDKIRSNGENNIHCRREDIPITTKRLTDDPFETISYRGTTYLTMNTDAETIKRQVIIETDQREAFTVQSLPAAVYALILPPFTNQVGFRQPLTGQFMRKDVCDLWHDGRG
jgi:hypothetical protein